MSDRGGFVQHAVRFAGIWAVLMSVVLITRTQRGLIYWFVMSIPWIILFTDRSSDPFVMHGTAQSWRWTIVIVAGLIYVLGSAAWDHEGGTHAVVWWLPILCYPMGIIVFGHTVMVNDGTNGQPRTEKHMVWDCSAQLANRADHGTVYNRDGSYPECSYKISYDTKF